MSMANEFSVFDTGIIENGEDKSEVIAYLEESNVKLTNKQIEKINEMAWTLEELLYLDINTEFPTLCQELELSIGPCMKLKVAIINLQNAKKKKSIQYSDETLFDAGHACNEFTIIKTSRPMSDSMAIRSVYVDHAQVNSETNLQKMIAMGFNRQNSMIALELNRNDIHKAVHTLTSGTISSFLSKQKEISQRFTEKMTVALIGNSGVGKSSILTRFMDNTFDERRVQTMGTDYREKQMDIIDTSILLRVLDTAGQERFR